MRYVAGFLFSEDHNQLLLIQKNRPKWQAGLYNAIGGKIEPGETDLAAMHREFKEETGLEDLEWKQVMVLTGQAVESPGWEVVFYKAFSNKVYRAKTLTDEKLGLVNVVDVPRTPTIPNLKWLVPLCLDNDIVGSGSLLSR